MEKTKRTRQARETHERAGEKMVEIARSFSYKHNAGRYESQDFFCSQKTECKESESNEVSERLYIFCKENVIRDLNNWIKEKEEKEKQKVEEVYKNAQQPVVEATKAEPKNTGLIAMYREQDGANTLVDSCQNHDHAPNGECLVVEWQGSGQVKDRVPPTPEELSEAEKKEVMAEMAREDKKENKLD